MSLSGVDLAIIAIYFLAVLAIGLYLKRFAQSGEDFFLAGREMTAWVAGLSFRLRESRIARTARLGRLVVSIRHPRRALVLDRRHPGDAFSRHRHDAVLLHLENPFGPRIPATPLRPRRQRAQRDHVRRDDHPDVGRQHVRHGRGDESDARLEHSLQHLGFFPDGRNLCRRGRTLFRDFQRSAAILPNLVRRAADSHFRPDRNRRLERHGRADPAQFSGPGFYAPAGPRSAVSKTIPWACTGPASSSASAR